MLIMYARDSKAGGLKRNITAIFCMAVFLASSCFGYQRGDFNQDGIVNFVDFASFGELWLKTPEEVNIAEADFIIDGIVDFLDLAVLTEQWQAPFFPREYNVGSYAIDFSRESTGYNSEVNEFAANTPRTELACVSSVCEVEIITDANKIYEVRDVVPEGVFVTSDVKKKLYTTIDGVNFTLVGDISTLPDITSSEGIGCVKVLSDGSWLIFTYSDLTYANCHVIRSEDKGATWNVVQMFRGSVDPWQKNGFRDNECVFGEYGAYWWAPNWNNPRRIWYSDDYGRTWSVIYTPADVSQLHCHLAVFSPLDTSVIYASYGDGTVNSRIVKLVHTGGSKKDPQNWIEANNSPLTGRSYNPVCGFPSGNYIYWGKDAGAYPLILRHDVRNDTFKTSLDFPTVWNDPNCPYWNSANNLCFSIVEHNGIYYAPLRCVNASPAANTGGIYVSADGEHWACAYREEIPAIANRQYGFMYLHGYCNGYLWGEYRPDGIETSSVIYRFKPVNAVTKPVLPVERGITNIFSENASSFESSSGGWYVASGSDCDYSASGRTTETALDGSACFKVVPHDSNHNWLSLDGPFWRPVPKKGDYIVASAYFKPGPNFPEGYGADSRQQFRLLVTNYGGTTGAIDYRSSYFALNKNMPDWKRVVVWGQCTDGNFYEAGGYGGPWIRLDLGPVGYKGSDFSDAVFYMDCAQVVYFNDLHYSGAWQKGGSARANEAGVVPLAGLNNVYSISFTWLPNSGSDEWHSNTNIASIAGDDGNYVDLIYDINNSKFCLTDGTNSISTVGTYTWKHLDVIHFCITNDGTNTTLYLKASLRPAGESVTGSSIQQSRLPVFMLLNTDHSQSSFGCGRFANIRVWDSVLPQAEVLEVLDTVDNMVQ